MRNTSNTVMTIANSWTWCGWIKVLACDLGDIYFNVKASGGNQSQILITSNGSAATATDLRVQLYSDGSTLFKDYSYTNLVRAGAWMHLGVTWDGTTLLVYRNGIAITASTLTADTANSQVDRARAVSVCCTPATTGQTAMRPSNYAMWNTVLTASEIMSVYAAAGSLDYRSIQGTSLMHWWPFNGSSFAEMGADLGNAANLVDLSTNAVTTNLTIVRDAPVINETAPTPYFPGHRGCLYFDGNATQTIGPSANNYADLGIGNTWSFMLWIKPDENAPSVARSLFVSMASNNLIAIDYNGGGANDPTHVQFRSSANVVIKDYSWNNSLYNGGAGLGPTKWNQFICTWDGTTLTGYLDSVATAASTKSTDSSGVMTLAPRYFSISSNTVANQNYLGKIYQVAVWGRALTQTEVTALYNGGLPADVDARTVAPVPLHWWLFGYRDITGGTLDRGVVDFVDSANAIDIWTSFGTASVSISNVQTDFPGA
jgi:hypothetical protein